MVKTGSALAREISVDEFVRRLRKYARDRDLVVKQTGQGKGSHTRLYLGEKFITLIGKHKMIRTGLLKAYLTQLDIKPEDF